MRKNVLSLSIAAMIGGLGFAGAASAGIAYETGAAANTAKFPATNANYLAVNADGIGHNLLVPYFSVQEGNGTLLSVVNTDTTNGKAVKVRFRGAANSDDVFDFSLFLSPGDVWTANVYQDETGAARLFTPDNSCTLPRSAVLNATSFKTDRVYQGDVKETYEGYVEIFNMADIPPQVAGVAATGVDSTNGTGLIANPLFTAIKHTSAGTNPCGLASNDAALPAAVTALKADPTLTNILGSAADADRTALMKHGFWAPSTGLMGSWTLLNVYGASVAWSANMVAVEARTTVDNSAARGRIVFSPQRDESVAIADVNKLTSDPLLRNTGVAPSTARVEAAQYDLPDRSTPYLMATTGAAIGADDVSPVRQANALTFTLATKSVKNEYVTNADISGQTDWVFSMPTRRYAIGVDYTPPAPATKPVAMFNSTATMVPAGSQSPFFTAVNTKMGAGGSSGNPIYQACVETGGGSSTVTAFDQEERSASGEFVVSPGTAKKVVFCGETSVLTINGTSSLAAKIAAKDIDTGYVNGWMNIATPGNGALGLPVLGHSFVRMTGPAVAGKSTNFSITQEHRYQR